MFTYINTWCFKRTYGWHVLTRFMAMLNHVLMYRGAVVLKRIQITGQV